jgi:uncharacterized protein (TIGR02145 family)
MKRNIIIQILLLVILTFTLISCKKDDNVVLPEVTTYIPLYIASTVATVGCTVESDGGADVICGIYMGTSTNPETTGIQFQIGSETGIFLGQVTGLTANTQYFVKAYAINSKGENLGEEINFTTPGTILDYEENVYNTVIIGDQTWMAENLEATMYRNGELIETTTLPESDISGESTPRYQWAYEGNVTYPATYGRLYTWHTVTDNRNVCPTGWHIPSDAEWTTLETTLGGFNIAGSKLKEAGNSHWISPYNLDASNESCFKALPGGYRNETGNYAFMGNNGYWWSSTASDVNTSWIRSLTVQTGQVSRVDFIKNNGASVRCVKD